MQGRHLFCLGRLGAGGSRVAVTLVVAVVAAILVLLPGAVAASAAPHRVAPARLAREAQLSLAQAPAGLRAAVRRTLGAGAQGTAWSQQAKLTASPVTGRDRFGLSVALSGSTAVVGAPFTNGPAVGAAYVFVHTTTGWSQQAKLTEGQAAGTGGYFGRSVALSGSTAIICGHNGAFVFVHTTTGWSLQAKLLLTEANLAPALSGSTAVIGAPDDDSTDTGAAYVFVHTTTGWSQQAKLTASNAATSDEFGYSVALSGSTAVIGAPFKNSYAGAAYVFVHTTTGWSQQARLTASNAASNDNFGGSVALSGSTAVIGAPGKNSYAGAAYVFVHTTTGWSQQAKLTASGAASDEGFGSSAVLSGSTAIIGAPGVNAFARPGAAYVFMNT